MMHRCLRRVPLCHQIVECGVGGNGNEGGYRLADGDALMADGCLYCNLADYLILIPTVESTKVTRLQSPFICHLPRKTITMTASIQQQQLTTYI